GVTLMSALAEIFFLPFFIAGLLLANLVVQAFGQQADLVDTCIPYVIHNQDDVAVLGATIALDENLFVQLGGKKIINFGGKVGDRRHSDLGGNFSSTSA